MPRTKDTQRKKENRQHRSRKTPAPAALVVTPAAGRAAVADGSAGQVVDSTGRDFSQATFQRHAELLGESHPRGAEQRLAGPPCLGGHDAA